VGCLDAQEVSGPGAFTSARKNRFASKNTIPAQLRISELVCTKGEQRGEEILRELARLNPDDSQEDWKNV
jgi:hypothetical protein